MKLSKSPNLVGVGTNPALRRVLVLVAKRSPAKLGLASSLALLLGTTAAVVKGTSRTSIWSRLEYRLHRLAHMAR